MINHINILRKLTYIYLGLFVYFVQFILSGASDVYTFCQVIPSRKLSPCGVYQQTKINNNNDNVN